MSCKGTTQSHLPYLLMIIQSKDCKDIKIASIKIVSIVSKYQNRKYHSKDSKYRIC